MTKTKLTRRASRRSLSRKTVLPFLAVAVGTAIYALPTPAEACCGPAFQIRPNTQDQTVPANTKVWLVNTFAGECDSATLVDESGNTVPVTRSTISRSGNHNSSMLTIVLTPERDLAIGETYHVENCQTFSMYGDLEFTVTAEPDRQIPAVPMVTFDQMHVDHEGDTSLGEFEYAGFDVSSDDGLILMDVAGHTQVSDDGPSGQAVDLFASKFAYLGDNACVSNWNPAEDAIGVRFALFDLAGNRSEWSAPQEVLFTEADDGDAAGCSVSVLGVDHPRTWAGLLLLTALGVGLRRRCRVSGV